MSDIYQNIKSLQGVPTYSKHEQVVTGIINSIDDKILFQGAMLPSVNNMVRELGYASKTIVKAYEELKERGIVESKNRLGYFVINEATEQKTKVALLIYALQPYQEAFYNAFRKKLGKNAQVDVFFHHNNIVVFETILNNIQGRYGMYVVAPIPHTKTRKILDKLPRKKLLLVDRYEQLDGEFSHVTQEFEINMYVALKELKDAIKKYNEFTLFFEPDSDSPKEILRAFRKFVNDYGINGKIKKRYKPGTLKKGNVYFTTGDSDLWKILKDAKNQSLNPGTDFGVISENDVPVKEIIFNGITTLSTDFEKMGKRAAYFVLNKKPMQEVIPNVLIKRNSLK